MRTGPAKTALATCVAGLVLALGAPSAKETAAMKHYTIGKLSFDAPVDHVEVREVGVNAHEVALMKPGAPTEKGAWVTFYTMSKDELAGLPAAARLPNFKVTYLATAKPAERPATRKLLGHEVTGDWQSAKVPRALTLEAYEVPLPDGGELFVGMRHSADFPEADAKRFFDGIAASLGYHT